MGSKRGDGLHAWRYEHYNYPLLLYNGLLVAGIGAAGYLRGVLLPLDVHTLGVTSVRLREPTLCWCVVGVRAVHRLRASSQALTNHAANN